ncbi:hypothetical protein FACS1894219_12570 [Clostridia bacterium]|nr:hypothetical protein FACS1894219_12570 [Clostridia bacterium]
MKKFTRAIAVTLTALIFALSASADIGTLQINWLVEPTLPYESVYYCWNEDSFYMTDGTKEYSHDAIDSKTGLKTGEEHPGHDGDSGLFYFNRQLGVFVAERAMSGCVISPEMDPNRLYKVGEIFFPDDFDGTNSTLYDFDRNPRYTVGSEYKMYLNGKPVDDLVYTNDMLHDFTKPNGLYYAAKNADGKWGIIRNGLAEVAFDFDDALIIDNTSAFVKYNGYYGIISLTGNAGDISSDNGSDIAKTAPRTADFKISDILILAGTVCLAIAIASTVRKKMQK